MIVATFAEDGVCSDPTAGEGLSGDDIAAYAHGLWATFPELSSNIVSAVDTGVRLGAVTTSPRWDLLLHRRSDETPRK